MSKTVVLVKPMLRVHSLYTQYERNKANKFLQFDHLGLMVLRRCLRRMNGIHPVIVDLNHLYNSGKASPYNFFQSAELLLENEPLLIGFSCIGASFPRTLSLVSTLKMLKPEVAIVLGGPHVAPIALSVLEKFPQIDAIALGAGEESLVGLVQYYLGACSSNEVSGVAIRTSAGIVHSSLENVMCTRHEEISPHALEDYDYPDAPAIPIETTRGCKHGCSFCSSSAFFRGRRTRVENDILVNFMKQFEAKGHRNISLEGDLFVSSRAEVTELCLSLIQGGAFVSWSCSTRMESVDRELLGLMGSAGCRRIYFGLEHVSRRVRSHVGKLGADLDPLAQASLCLASGIQPIVSFIAGLPTETTTEFISNLIMYFKLCALGTDVQIHQLRLFPGSKLYKNHISDGMEWGAVRNSNLGGDPRYLTKHELLMIYETPDIFSNYFFVNLSDIDSGYLEIVEEFCHVFKYFARSLATALMSENAKKVLQEVLEEYIDARGRYDAHKIPLLVLERKVDCRLWGSDVLSFEHACWEVIHARNFDEEMQVRVSHNIFQLFSIFGQNNMNCSYEDDFRGNFVYGIRKTRSGRASVRVLSSGRL